MAACVIHPGAKDRDGYGYGSWRGKSDRAHRVAWKKVHGEIPRGMSVCHTCDNPSCVNVAHLFLGTPKQNTHDAMRKERLAYSSKNTNTKLSDDDVRWTRKFIAAGAMVHREIASIFKVSQASIAHIATGRNRSSVY